MGEGLKRARAAAVRSRCQYCFGRGRVCGACGKGVNLEADGHDECRRANPDGLPPASCPVCTAHAVPKVTP